MLRLLIAASSMRIDASLTGQEMHTSLRVKFLVCAFLPLSPLNCFVVLRVLTNHSETPNQMVQSER